MKRLTKTELFRWGKIKMGVCTYCNCELCDIPPGAKNYYCPDCDRQNVFGLDELLKIGYVELIIEPKGSY